MAPQRQTHSISRLPTRSVTIYPTRAAVVRDLPNLELHPGTNEIVLNHLTTHADEHSIRVEGRGTDALVTDMTVVQVPWEDDSESPSEDDDGLAAQPFDLDAAIEAAANSQELKTACERAENLEREEKIANAALLAARQQHTWLAKYTEQQSLNKGANNEDFIATLGTYSDQWVRISASIHDLESKLEKTRKELAEAQKAKSKLVKPLQEAHQKKESEKAKLRQEKAAEKPPKLRQMYKITITLENPETLPEAARTAITAKASTGKPASSKDQEPPKEAPEAPYLRISYITDGASWSPRYDLRLDTTNKTGTLTYRALFINNTYELWRGANVTLSTSNNTFKGLNDKPPSLYPWNIGIQKADARLASQDYAMKSPQELVDKTAIGAQGKTQIPYTFDPTTSVNAVYARGGEMGLLSRENAVVTSASVQKAKKKRGAHIPINFPTIREMKADDDEDMGFGLFDGDEEDDEDSGAYTMPIQLQQKQLQLATAASLSHGTTTTYELPGEKTVPPSPVARQHVIAEIQVEDIALTYHCVPKLRESVFLTASVTLPSASTSILEGPAGLTLDGSYLGQTSIPRKSAGETFKLDLGVDEALTVKNSKPVRKKASQGVSVLGFNNKEDLAVYSRHIRLSSAKDAEVKVVVKDQVPVSDNEKLRISVIYPRGLRVDNKVGVDVASGEKENVESSAGSVASGKRASIVGIVKEEEKIGKCYLKKNGEVRWEVELGGQKGKKEVELVLEYEARMPSDVAVVAV